MSERKKEKQMEKEREREEDAIPHLHLHTKNGFTLVEFCVSSMSLTIGNMERITSTADNRGAGEELLSPAFV